MPRQQHCNCSMLRARGKLASLRSALQQWTWRNASACQANCSKSQPHGKRISHCCSSVASQLTNAHTTHTRRLLDHLTDERFPGLSPGPFRLHVKSMHRTGRTQHAMCSFDRAQRHAPSCMHAARYSTGTPIGKMSCSQALCLRRGPRSGPAATAPGSRRRRRPAGTAAGSQSADPPRLHGTMGIQTGTCAALAS